MRALLFSTAAAILVSQQAEAVQLEANARIDAVTLYQDAATVTRIVEVDIPVGQHSLVLKGLSPQLDAASLRVKGEGSAPLVIGSVDIKHASAKEQPVGSEAADIRRLTEQKDKLTAELATAEARRAMIVRYSEASPMRTDRDGKGLDLSEWPKAWEIVGQGLAQALEDIRLKKAALKQVDDDLNRLGALAGLHAPRNEHQAHIALSAEAGTKARLIVSYRVSGAQWSPLYDARLSTQTRDGAMALDLVRRAEIVQNTGEDWSDVALTLSTATAWRGTAMPDVLPQRLGFYEPPQPYAGGAMHSKILQEAPAPAAAPDVRMAAPVVPPVSGYNDAKPAIERETQVRANGYNASFVAPERVTIAGNGVRKTIRLGSAALAPQIIIRTAPALEETAYLEARIVNSEEAPWLAGPVSVFRDGEYVGEGNMDFTAPSDSATLGFGPDAHVKVTRVPVRRKENEPTWLGQTKTEMREFKTSVKNLHAFAVKVMVVDQVPISENSAIVIEMQNATTPPTEKNMEAKRGVMGWTFDLKAQESKDIRLAYRMKWPADREVVFETVK